MAMRGGSKVSDYQINGSVRRVLASREVDMTNLHYRSTSGCVDISGKLKFREPKSIPEIMKELLILEELIFDVNGVRRVSFNLDDWERSNSGGYVKKLETEEEQED
jgi:hypothetical protein